MTGARITLSYDSKLWGVGNDRRRLISTEMCFVRKAAG
jgi:hypothetical protein